MAVFSRTFAIAMLAMSLLATVVLGQDPSNAPTSTPTPGKTKAQKKEEFPLVWVCLGITVVGVIIALYVAYVRPAELHLPGTTVMTATEKVYVDGESAFFDNSAEKSGSGEAAQQDAKNRSLDDGLQVL